MFADPADPEHINRQLLNNDLERLATELEHIVAWANKTFAHLDPAVPRRVPSTPISAMRSTALAAITSRYQLLPRSVEHS